jgi:hypothetical protein
MPDDDFEKTKIGSLGRYLVWAASIVVAITTLTGVFLTMRDWEAWCKNFGLYCSRVSDEVESRVVYVESGGTKDNKSDECKEHKTLACINPSNKDRALTRGAARFKTIDSAGAVFIDGNPTNPDPIGTSNIGWFIDDTQNTSEKICAIVYARTSACETRVFLRGRLLGKESARE